MKITLKITFEKETDIPLSVLKKEILKLFKYLGLKIKIEENNE